MEPEKVCVSKIVKEELINLNRIGEPDSPSHCGYCGKDQSYSYGLVKDKMHPYVYQLLAERGWRRCGTYYYKPDLQKSCCKLWTHRQDVGKFVLKKDQKKTLKKLMKIYYKSASDSKQECGKPTEQQNGETKSKKQKMAEQIPIQIEVKMRKALLLLIEEISNHKAQFVSLFKASVLENINAQAEFSLQNVKDKLKFFKSAPNAEADFYCNLVMILLGVNKKMFKKQYKNTDFVKDIKGWVLNICENEKLRDQNFEFDIERSGYFLFKRKDHTQSQKPLPKPHTSNMKPHQKPHENKMKEKDQNSKKHAQGDPQNGTHEGQFFISSEQIRFGQLVIKLVPAQLTKQGWKVYQDYCQEIHNKPEKSQSSYKGFLCEQGLNFLKEQAKGECQKTYTPSWDAEGVIQKPKTITGSRKKHLGCYHMNYYLKDELIGVGVVDILPDGLSSVYFFYHPRFKDQRLGVFSSLIEIEYIRWMSLSFPEFKNYYMGFYIQNNHKMSYKADYEPFCLLCPVSYKFVEFTPQMRESITKIEKKQIASVKLSPSIEKIPDMNFTEDLGIYISQRAKFKYQGRQLALRDLRASLVGVILNILKTFIQVWGKELFDLFVFTF